MRSGTSVSSSSSGLWECGKRGVRGAFSKRLWETRSVFQGLRKLDQFELLILDDIGYVQQDAEQVEVLFTLMAERYERRSMLITSNLVFSQWDRIFKDPMTTAAAIDRLVHHSVILEFDVSSYRSMVSEQEVSS
jgi:DNA replication protein DnaC